MNSKQGGSIVQEAKDAATAVKDEIKHDLTILWDALPTWQRDNAYIHSGYRPQSNSFRKSFGSLNHLHNETVNIYSHLLGALLFLFAGLIAFVVFKPRYAKVSHEDVYVFGCFFAGAVACLGMSATYHTISNHSPAVAKLGNKLDYLGIVFLIWGSFVPSIYYGFADSPNLIKTYWTMITTIGAGCAVVSTNSTFRTPQWRPFRAGMFAAMGLSAVVPVIHGLTIHGADEMSRLIGLYWLVLQGFLYILGAGIYAARVPEKLAPGSFDIWGSSHQIFHVLVVAAAVAHLTGLVKAFDYHHTSLLSKLL